MWRALILIAAIAGCADEPGGGGANDLAAADDLAVGVGAACGAGVTCPAGSFCQTPVGACGGDGGVCVAEPASCGPATKAMCGCDQNNYYNECQREKAGVSKLHDGTCQLKFPCFTLGEALCKARFDCAADYCVLCSCTPQFNGCRDMLTPPKPCPTPTCAPPGCCRAINDCPPSMFFCAPPEPAPMNVACPPPCADNLQCNASGQCERQPCAHDADCLKGFCVEKFCYSELGNCTVPPG
ncbi:MAG TPA: hypothetical protein VFF06_35025 [Polyangia bacterium]|nr:hypothetical protein [Polyangia bacterium]